MYRPLVLVCVVLAGCATYQPRPIAPAQLSQRFEERSLNSETLHAWLERQPGHDAGRWPLPRWNREMLTLAAYYYSPALDIARAQ
ncbi:MAG TPA: TolC family protein, partial [Noviherbaspirillum sp.]